MIDLLVADQVSVFRDKQLGSYFKQPPFHPSIAYPEYPFPNDISQSENKVYDAVRNAIKLLGLDYEHFGTKDWNPFGEVIRPGDHVVIKPNFVLHTHFENGDYDCVVTQPDVIRAVCDYAYIALKGEGSIVIADAPQANCDFDELLRRTKISAISEFYQDAASFDIPILDLRQLKLKDFTDSRSRVIQDGDPLGYVIVDMKDDSSFIGLKNIENLYGADFDRKETVKHHHGNVHEYCVSKTVLSADVVICVPKMKVHRKAGVTLNLKNLIGINGNKNYLPHYRVGLPEDGGDEFPKLSAEQKNVMYSNRILMDVLLAKPSRFKSALYRSARSGYHVMRKILPKTDVLTTIRGGDWHGNDTVWRTLLDLNTIFIYADSEGKLHDTPQRRFISVIDGVVAGEKEGPLVPTAKPCGVIACGLNPLTTDLAVARIMGFDTSKIPKFRGAAEMQKYKLSLVDTRSIRIFSNVDAYRTALGNSTDRFLNFVPARGWIGSIEI